MIVLRKENENRLKSKKYWKTARVPEEKYLGDELRIA